MFELGHAGVGGMRVRVDQAWQHHLAAQVNQLGLRAANSEHLLVGADHQQPPIAHARAS